MSNFGFSRCVVQGAIAAAVALGAGASHADVGVKVILQGWEPWNDNRQPTVVPINDPRFVSGPIEQAWRPAFAQPLCEQITAIVRTPDLVTRGVSLYNVSCNINMPQLRLVPLSNSRVKLIATVSGSSLAATATTPNLKQLGVSLPVIGGLGLGSGVDPRFAVSLDAEAEIDVEIGDAPRPFLTVHNVQFNLKRADARGVNITGKIGEWVASRVIPFFGGPNFEQMVESRINAVRGSFTARAQQALQPVNARVAGYSQYVRVATWTSNTRIAVAMQPRSLPLIRTTGEMRGAVTGARTRIGEPGRPVDCAGFRVTASYQVEPAPIVNPDTLALGPAKRVSVGSPADVRSHGDGTCSYSLRGLALGMTNYVQAAHAGERMAAVGSQMLSASVKLEPSGWDGVRVNPRPVDTNRNYVLVTKFWGNRVADAIRGEPARRIDPVIMEGPTVLHKGGSAGAAAIRALGNAALNPQPLPPSAPTSAVAPVLGSVSSISPASRGSAGAAAIRALGDSALNPQPLPPRTPIPTNFGSVSVLR
jgi:hypothetical protein